MELSIVMATLKQSKTLNSIAWGIFLITALTVGFLATRQSVLVSLLVAFVLLVIQSYYALRLTLDYEFFTILQSHNPTVETLQEFDQALHQLKLIKTVPNERSLNHRIQGTMALIKAQLIYLALQAILYITIILLLLLL